MRYFFLGSLLLVAIGLVSSCKSDTKNKGEKPLARVYNDFLYPSDLDGIIGAYTSSEDSAVLVSAYIENWAKKRLMQRIATENIPNLEEVNEQVEAYRASLEQYYYEKALVAKQLDSLVNPTEIKTYYEQTKPNHVLKQTVMRCYLVKVADDTPEIEELKKWWKMKEVSDYDYIKEYCQQYGQYSFLEDSTWLTKDYLAAQLPVNTLNQGNMVAGKDVIFKNDGYWYFLKVREIALKGSIAPMSYIKEEATRFILHQRKLKLIENTANTILEREQNKSNVEIFVN